MKLSAGIRGLSEETDQVESGGSRRIKFFFKPEERIQRWSVSEARDHHLTRQNELEHARGDHRSRPKSPVNTQIESEHRGTEHRMVRGGATAGGGAIFLTTMSRGRQ